MSKEFIEKRIGSSSLAEAVRQQDQLSYFTEGSIQQPITDKYIEAFVNRKYATEDQFLNWIKTIFGQNNFLLFFKFLRNPVPSTKLVNDKIKPQLERVFHAEDSFFNYVIKGKDVEEPEILEGKQFSEWMLNSLMYRHNDILVHDLEDVNSPVRNLIDIHNVIAIRSDKSVIHQLAYTAEITVGESEIVKGYLYLDKDNYIFYDDDYNEVDVFPHDLGECPADYISREPFSNDDIVRKSMFSYVGTDLEEYTFLKTLQRMTEPNGAIPTTAVLKFANKDDNSDDVDNEEKAPNQPMSISSQSAKYQTEVVGKQTEVQVGTIHDVTARLKEDGSIDSAAVQNYIKHFYMPVESLNYLRDRLVEISNDIIQSVTGDFKEQNEAAQNEKQVSKGYITKQDSLRSLSDSLTRIRERSDSKMLRLQYGVGSIVVDVFYGSDHFQESQQELFERFEKAPNPIERKELLVQMSKNKYRFNPDKSKRKEILYSLMPYVSDKDFNAAVDAQRVSDVNFEYQTRFTYWVSLFEAMYGDVVIFWDALGEGTAGSKIQVINKLILQEVGLSVVTPPVKEQVN